MELIKDFPFMFLLALVGFMIGSVVVSPLGMLDYDFSTVFSTDQPMDIFVGYFNNTILFYAESFLYGLVGGVIFGLRPYCGF